MAIYLTEEQVAALAPMPDVIAALEAAFQDLAAGRADVQPRQRIRLPSGALNLMPAGISGAGFGFKAYPATRGGIRFMFTLFDENDARPLVVMEADRLGQLRTGAASGLATKYMARNDASVVGIVGTGHQAATQLAAICAVRSVKEARCYSRVASRRQQFAEMMTAQLGISVRPVETARDAVEGVDVVVTITSSREPVFEGAWLSAGTHVNAAGVNQSIKREIDTATVRHAGTVVVDLLSQARVECGDLLAAEREGAFDWSRAHDLAAVVAGTVPGRQNPEEITLFESQGIALEDVALGALVYRRAVERGMGAQLPF